MTLFTAALPCFGKPSPKLACHRGIDEDGLPYDEIPDDSHEGLSEEERKKRGIPNEDGTMPGHKEYEVEDGENTRHILDRA